MSGLELSQDSFCEKNKLNECDFKQAVRECTCAYVCVCCFFFTNASEVLAYMDDIYLLDIVVNEPSVCARQAHQRHACHVSDRAPCKSRERQTFRNNYPSYMPC